MRRETQKSRISYSLTEKNSTGQYQTSTSWIEMMGLKTILVTVENTQKLKVDQLQK